MNKEDPFVFIPSSLMGFGESDSSGAWIKLQVDKDDLEYMRGRKGLTVDALLRFRDEAGNVIHPTTGAILQQGESPDTQIEEKPKKGPHGEYWKNRVQAGVFGNVNVLKALGSDASYQDYVRSLPCLVSGGYDDIARSRNVFAHVLRAEAAPSGGKGEGSNKPIFSGVPLQQEYHALQHSGGWRAVYSMHNESRNKNNPSIEEKEASDWIMKKVRKHRLAWARQRMFKIFDTDSLSHISPATWVRWYENNVTGA